MFEVEVARGAALLDHKNPGWWRAINIGFLDMEKCTRCILGQLYGQYQHGLNQLEMWESNAARHGFYVMPPLPSSLPYEEEHMRNWVQANLEWARQWQALGDAWVTEIERRYKEEAASVSRD
jgi:hypothetical protein